MDIYLLRYNTLREKKKFNNRKLVEEQRVDEP